MIATAVARDHGRTALPRVAPVPGSATYRHRPGRRPGPDLPDLRDTARSAVQAQIDEAVAADPALGSVAVAVDVVAMHGGPPGRALVEAATGADLLVLGHRGHGALSSAVLGSVGLYCVLHATSPVTIVPAGWSASPAVPVPSVAAGS